MIRKKRTFRATDTEYQTIRAYATAIGRTVSDFVRHAALSEIKKHVPRQGLEKVLKPLVEDIIHEALRKRFPTRGNAAGGHFSGSQ